MTVRGYIDRYTGKVVSGWARDTESTTPLVVALYVNDLELYRARADLARGDLKRQFDTDVGGFHLRIGARLASLLPDGATLSVRVEGAEPIPLGPNASDRVVNPECDSLDALRGRLGEGWRVSSKSGELYRPLSARGTDTDVLLDGFEHCSAVMKRELGLDLLLGYGTLLGAVRDGDFIGHDDDIDGIFYVPTATTGEACQEFARIVARLSEIGDRLKIVRSGQLHWFPPRCPIIDVFMGWFDQGMLYSYCAGGVPLTREDVAPIPFEFRGRTFSVPAAYEQVLEATYGPGWRVPDPLFQWRVKKEVAVEMAALERLWTSLPRETAPAVPTRK